MMGQFSRSELLTYTNGPITYARTHTHKPHTTQGCVGHYYSGFSEGQLGLKASGGQLCLLHHEAVSLPLPRSYTHYFWAHMSKLVSLGHSDLIALKDKHIHLQPLLLECLRAAFALRGSPTLIVTSHIIKCCFSRRKRESILVIMFLKE